MELHTPEPNTIGAFSGKCVDEYETCIGSGVNDGCGAREVPEETRAILVCLLLKCIEWC
jgi:hypothetical protein